MASLNRREYQNSFIIMALRTNIFVFLLLWINCSAFSPLGTTRNLLTTQVLTPHKSSSSPSTSPSAFISSKPPSSTRLYRQWNFNNDSSPWGMKNNAEIWNGRVAQMAIIVIIIQESVTGKGVIQGIQDGNFLNMFLGALTAFSVVGLTGWLAIKGEEDDISW